MTRVTILPSNVEFEAETGETVMGAAQARGYYWPTTCGGQGICTTCLSEVVSGGEVLSEMSRSERKTLIEDCGESILKRPVRLACQAAVLLRGSLTIQKLGVRPANEP